MDLIFPNESKIQALAITVCADIGVVMKLNGDDLLKTAWDVASRYLYIFEFDKVILPFLPLWVQPFPKWIVQVYPTVAPFLKDAFAK